MEGEGYIGGEMMFFSLSGDHLRFSVYIHLKKNLLVVNINYLLMTYHLGKSIQE